MSPRSRCQRSVTCEGVLPCWAAILPITSSSSTLPWAIGDQASTSMPCRIEAARASSLAKYGCTSIWFTAGTTPVSATTRSRCAGWKFETPIERARPSSTNEASVRQVETKSPS